MPEEKKAVLVIAPNNFRDEELFYTKEELEKAGVKTTIASISTEEANGMLGGKAKPQITLEEVTEEDFDAIVFIGGSGASIYFENKKAWELAREFNSKEKVTAAICIAPSILANAGLLKGKKVTVFPSEASNLKEKGATYTGVAVEVDGNIVTAEGPGSAREFGKRIAEELKGR